MQLRIETFNALNHTQFGTVNSGIENGAAFGTITSTGVSARQVQLGLLAARFIF